MRKILYLAVTIILLTHSTAIAADDLVKAWGEVCAHGLHPQPGGGPFSVFLFCDDAVGSNIGVILTQPGAGPGSIKLPEPKQWDKWDEANRFWQEREWASDVTSFAWSSDLKSLYVATSEIYGTGAVYKLNLLTRSFKRLFPETDQINGAGYQTEITKIDRESGEVFFTLHFYNPATKHADVIQKVLK